MIGGLFAISIYLLLSRQLMRWLFGIVILSSSTNLVIFVAGRLYTSVPPFVVFSDASLVEMSAYKPTNNEAFLAINGVGNKKLESYGEVFIQLISTYQKS